MIAQILLVLKQDLPELTPRTTAAWAGTLNGLAVTCAFPTAPSGGHCSLARFSKTPSQCQRGILCAPPEIR